MADRPLRPATHRCLGEPLPHQQANGPRAHPDAEAEASFPTTVLRPRGTFGISPSFLGLSQSSGQVTHVLLTRSRLGPGPKSGSSLHLHVLGTPPAFVLSQDQTLREELHKESSGIRRFPIGYHKWQPARVGIPDPSLVGSDPCAHATGRVAGAVGSTPLNERNAPDGPQYTSGAVKHKTGSILAPSPLHRTPYGVPAEGRRRTWTHNLDRGFDR